MSKAISVDPTGDFDGNDGKWSTFPFQIGTPPQVVALLPATSGQETWVITPAACAEDDSACRNGRGHLFNASSSSTWEEEGFYAISWTEGDEIVNEYTDEVPRGYYGYDTVVSGWPGGATYSVNDSVVAGTSTGPWLGQFGLSPRPTNFTNFTDSHPSFLTLLKQNEQITTLSYGYTAGAAYRDQGKGVVASLTLGGYDRSRFVPNDLSFPFNLDTGRDLILQLGSITAQSGSSDSISLLPEPIYTFVSSAVPHMWLPAAACSVFASELSLSYDDQRQFYFVNDTVHEDLLERNYTFTFTFLGNGSEKVDIAVPYASFDLEVSPDGSENTTRYFPLRRASTPDDEYTLGRAFLQEAYMIVDYERGNFSLHQAQFNTDKDVVAIDPPSASESGAPSVTPSPTAGASPPVAGSTNDNKNLKIFLPIGIVLGIALILAAVYLFWKRRTKNASQSLSYPDEKRGPTAEMDAIDARHEADGPSIGAEMDAGMRAELPGSVKAPHLLDGTGVVYEMDAGAVPEVSGKGVLPELNGEPNVHEMGGGTVKGELPV